MQRRRCNIWISRCCRGEGATTPTRDPSVTTQASPPIESPALLPTSTPAIPGVPATSESLFACEQASHAALRAHRKLCAQRTKRIVKSLARVFWFWEILRPRNVLLWPRKGVKESRLEIRLYESRLPLCLTIDQMPRKFKATDSFVPVDGKRV
jgi:hypothetical protein